MTTATKNNDFQTNVNGTVCCTIPWDQINEPGAYICNWSGHLLRVPNDGVASGRSPLLNIVGQDTLYVTKISNDPFITVTKARMLASNFDLNVSF
jgi:hypothetical protein